MLKTCSKNSYEIARIIPQKKLFIFTGIESKKFFPLINIQYKSRLGLCIDQYVVKALDGFSHQSIHRVYT